MAQQIGVDILLPTGFIVILGKTGTRFIFYKNHVYKNVEAQEGPL